MTLIQNYQESDTSWYFPYKDIIYTEYGAGLEVAGCSSLGFYKLRTMYRLTPMEKP
ncbi:hypothetical protein pVco7_gp008 [Vibrio phage pVco-7]|uniref:Uncharacterized protein n=1 Tax=Vibrio phage pVco-5 TaxID=1965485 RepID=A0A1W6JUR8_9CAUD|nr:hypothetical protein KNT61_gp009 [Vibrio phage pVco-5]ARM70997.1 hypothetical protein pVco5_009 [Vibrio phage pVco-5]